MHKCLKITLTVNETAIEPQITFLQNIVQKHARACSLEGMAQPITTDKIKIIVCGNKDDVDTFVGIIQQESPTKYVEDIEIEPHLKDRDYRGVFRILEL